MRRTSLFIAAIAMMLLTTAAIAPAQTARTLGANRIQLDDALAPGAFNSAYITTLGGSVGIDGVGTPTAIFPSACALLDVSSTTKGFLLPRMTNAQELNICGGLPPEGLLVYNLTNHTLDVFNGSAWGPIAGWTLRGNSITSGGTPLGGSYIGTNNAQDFVMATNGVEQARIDATGRMGVAEGGASNINALWALTVGTVGGNSTIQTGAERVVGLFTAIGGANINQSSGISTNINNTAAGPVNIGFTGGTTTVATGGAGNLVLTGIAADAAPSQWLTLNGSNQVRVTPLANIAEQGVSYQLEGGNVRFRLGGNVAGTGAGTVPFTTDRFINTNANSEHITMGAAGTDFATFNGGTGAIGLNSNAADIGATSIGNTTGGGVVTLASNTAGNSIILDVTNSVTNNLQLNNLATDALPTQWLSINGTNQVRITNATGTANEGIVFTSGAYRLGSTLTTGVGSNPFLVSRNVNLAANTLTYTGNVGGAGTGFVSLNGNTDAVGINNNAANTGATTIGNTTAGGSVSINSANPNPISINVGALTNNLSLNNISNGLLPTDINFLVMTAPNSGNTRWRTLSSFITGSNGVEVTYVGGVADAHFGPLNTSVPFATDRFINTAAFILHVTNGGTNDFASFNGNTSAIGLNNLAAATTNIGFLGGTNNIKGTTFINDATNNSTSINTAGSNGSVTIGNTASGGAVSINSSVSITGTSPINALNATTSTNTLTGQTGNAVTATTGNNVLTTSGAGQNNLNSNGAAGQNNLSATGAGGSNNLSGVTNVNAAQNFNTNINTGAGTGVVAIGSATNTGGVNIASNANPTAISLNVTNVANNLQLGNIANGANTDAVFLDMTTNTTGSVRTRTIGSMITGTQGVEVSYPFASAADAHLASTNTNVPFTSDRFINAAGFILHVTNNTPADFLTLNGANNAVNINNTTVGANNIGNGGGATVNTIGTSAASNVIGGSATLNQIANSAATNQIGNNAGSNNFGNSATTNQFGDAAPNNDFGVANTGVSVTNAVGNGSAAGNVLNNIGNRTGAGTVTTNIGNVGGVNNVIGSGAATLTRIEGPVNVNNNVTAATQINTGNSLGNVTIGNNTAGSGTTTIVSNKQGNANSIVLDVTAAATNNLQFLNIAADATPVNWLTINAANQVRSTPIATSALEGIVFTTGAFRLGSATAGNGAGTNPFLTNRHVNLDAFTLDFTVGNNTSQLLTLNAAANTVTVNSTNNTVNGATNVNTTTYALTTVGNGSSNHQLNVNGVVDAAVTDLLASPHWDLAVTGDIGASGIIKSGASLAMDGVSATRRLISDQAMTISTDLAGAGTGGNLAVQTTNATAALSLQTTGGGNIFLQSTGGNGAVSISTVGTGNISMSTAGSGNIAVGPTGSGNVTIQENGAHPVTISTVSGALSVSSTGSGSVALGSSGSGQVNISSTTSNVQTTTTTGNMTFNSTGTGNIELGNSTTIGALATPNTTLDVRGGVSMNIVAKGPGAPGGTAITDYVIVYTDNGPQGANPNRSLPLPAGTQGRVLIIKNSSVAAGYALDVTPPGGVLIDGVAGVYTIAPGGNTVRTFIFNAGNWYIIGN